MTPSIPSAAPAVRTYLQDILGDVAVYVGPAPPTAPPKFVLIRPMGGTRQRDFVPLSTVRYDLHCYATTYAEADALDRRVYAAMFAFRGVHSDVYIPVCQMEGGPIWQSDDEFAPPRPVVWRSYSMMVVEERVSAGG